MAKAPLDLGDRKVTLQLSIGAHIAKRNESERQALHRADLALYQSKAAGRAQMTVYSTELEFEELRRRALVEDVQHGLEQGLFFAEYQPIFDRDMNLVCFEALLRLTGRDGQVVGPRDFIPVAEETGLIDQLGAWLVQTAVRAMSDWPDDVSLAINLSSEQFRSERFASSLGNAIETYQIDASRIWVELTERVILDERFCASSQLNEIKKLGAKLAIDDFGTGFSSLSHLWRYDFDALKIDKSFFDAQRFDQERFSKIVGSIVGLGHKLDMVVTIEGVETQSQLDIARHLNCDLYQGFFLSKPTSAEQARAMAHRTILHPNIKKLG